MGHGLVEKPPQRRAQAAVEIGRMRRIPPRQAIRGGAADCGNSLKLSLDRSRSGVASFESTQRARHRNRDPNGAFERCESRERRR